MKKNHKKNTHKKNANVKKQKLSFAQAGFSKKRLIICLAAFLLLIASFMGIMVAVNAYRNSGSGIRDIVILKSEHFDLTVPMFSYYVRTAGVGEEQYEGAAEALMTKMTLYEAALSEGKTLSEKEREQVDQKIELISYDAEKEKMDLDEYLSVTYGRGVKVGDIRSLEEMLAVAMTKSESLLSEIAASEEELADYCKENGDDYLFCDFLFPLIEVPFTEGMTSSEKEAMVKEYEGYANEIAASENQDELFEKYIECLKKIQKVQDPDGEQTLTDADIDGIIERAIYTRQSYKNSLTSNLEIDTWLFSTDRRAGDGKVQKGGSIDKTVTFGIYYMTRPLYTNTDPTYTLYDILVPFSVYTEAASEANVKKVMEIYESTSTEATLKSLASQYRGGLSENFICTTSTNKELADWLSKERAKGDHMIYKDSDGWHFVCYQEQGLPECYAQAKDVLDSKELEEKLSSYAKKHLVALDTYGFSQVPELRYGWLIFG